MGCDITRWTPGSTDGTLKVLSPTLQSLEPFIDQMTVMSNMELKNAYPGTHATSNAAFLSAAKAKWTESTDYYLGTTADQIAAQQIGHETVLPSLELSMDLLQTVGQGDNGYAGADQLPDLDRPVGVPTSYAEHAKLMFDLQALAMQGDVTRVITFQLARETSTRTYPEIGVADPHHPLTHHGNNPEKIARMAK